MEQCSGLLSSPLPFLCTRSHVNSESELRTLQLLLHYQSVNSYPAMQHKHDLCFLTMTLSSAVIFTDPSLSMDVHRMIIYFANSHKCSTVIVPFVTRVIVTMCRAHANCVVLFLARCRFTCLIVFCYSVIYQFLVHFCAAKHFKFPYQTVIKIEKQVLCFSVFMLCNQASVSLLVSP